MCSFDKYLIDKISMCSNQPGLKLAETFELWWAGVGESESVVLQMLQTIGDDKLNKQHNTEKEMSDSKQTNNQHSK